MSKNLVPIGKVVKSANTGLDAIKRAPIVERNTVIKCLRIQDVSQKKKFNDWGNTEVEKRNFEKFQLKKNDIIIARTGASIGVNLIIKKDLNSVLNNGLIRIRTDDKKCDPNYLYFNFRSSTYNDFIESISGGTSTQPNMQINALLSYEINLPPLEEQKSIASVLSSLDDKIDLLHRQNKTLEAMAETLFRQWFVEEAGGFKKGKLGDWLSDTFGGEWGKEIPAEDFSTAVNCIRGTDIADFSNGLAEKIPLRFVTAKKLSVIQPKSGDIIFEISGGTETQSTGRAMYINELTQYLFDYPLVFSNFCRLFRPKNPEYLYFIYHYLRYLYKSDEFFGLENGSSGIKNLNYKALLFDIEYPMPDEDLVIEFNKKSMCIFNKICKNKFQIKTLIKLRDNLLPKLMSGEVRVSA